MTLSPAEMRRKVRQLDNDVQATYEMLVSIQVTQQRHGNRVAELTEMVAGQETRFDGIERRLDGHDARFDVIDGKLDSVLELLRDNGPATR